MLPLISLTQSDIDAIVHLVPDGLANIQDIYSLSPLQEGTLFHHMMAREVDPYVITSCTAFRDRKLLDQYLDAFQKVVDRHDILRTAILWENLSTPAQVVLRHVQLPVTEHILNPADGAIVNQLQSLYDYRKYRLDMSRAPLIRLAIAQDVDSRWIMLKLHHHIIGDRSTTEVMKEEIEEILSGRYSQLPAPESYRNFIAEARLRGVNDDRHEAFFKDKLHDIETPSLPYGISNTYSDGCDVTSAHHILPPILNSTLRGQSKRIGVSLATICHLAWAKVIASLSGQDRVVFGTVLFGRMQGGSGSDRAMGLYINTLPFRVDIDGSSVEDSVRKVQTDLATLLEHEHASLARAQRQSRIPSGTPLFSSLLNYRHNIVKTQTLQPDNGIHHIEAHERTNYPLTMSIEDNGQSLGLTCQIVQPYDPSRVCGYMHKVLQDLSNALEQSLEISMEKLDIMPAEERNMIIHSWNNTDRAYPSDQCLHQQFEEQARRNPEAIAVMHGDHSLTYEALNTRANQIAGTLIGMGIQPGDNVAILMERSIDLVATEIAILMAGAAYVPIDPRSPVERQVYIAMDCSAKIVVTDDTIGIPDKMELPILRLGASEAKNVSGITKIHIATSWTCSSMDTAYIMYTSGSTGQPKGVMVSKRGIARLVYNSGLVDIVFDDRVAFTTNPTFDISALEVWVPLLHGASIVIINNDTLLEAQRLSTAIDHYEITLLQLPTALFHQHAYVIGPTLSKLKYLICGGEQGLIDAFSAVVQYDGPVRFLNVYGPTEATVWATTYEVTRSIKDMERLPIGRPLGNTCVYVLDKHLVPVPIGVAGELYIGGPAVANGYLNRPHLAAKSFVPNIFSNVPGARMYKTGDLVRYLSDGNLVFLGRLDNQIKIRGFRVELGEIETRLVEHPDVREAIVITNGEGGDKQLVAYVVCDSRDVLSRVLREHLSTRIPEYMVPSAFVQLDSMPLTNNGKVDRSSLPDPGRISILAEKYVAPQGDTEITLAHIWSELLMVDCVGRHDNFFELGGHSLLAVRMLSIVRARMGVDLKLQSLFLTPTIAGLVQNPPLEDNNYDAFNVLLPLKTQGNRPPLFCVHPAFGASWSYRDLAQYLHPEQPLYGLQARGFDGKTPLASSIEEMTLDYIDQIRKIQPRGPYNLLGWSFGGPVAHNMALELEKCGEQVQLLAILDSLADYSELTDEGDEEEEENAITQVLSKLFADCMVSDLQLDVEDLRRRVSAVGTNNSRLLKYHIPSVVNADILFLRAAITGGNTHQLIDPTTWKPHTRNRLEVHDIQCTHGDMNKPEHLAAIGHVIRARLDVLQKSTFFRLIEM